MAGGFSASAVISPSSFGCSGTVSAAREKTEMHSDKTFELEFAEAKSHTSCYSVLAGPVTKYILSGRKVALNRVLKQAK